MPQVPEHDRARSAPGDHAGSNGEAPPGVSGEDGLLLRVIKDRRVAFLFVGGLNTVIGTLWFLLFDSLLGTKWNGYGHYPALVITYVFSILCAFVLYRKIVFRVHGNVWRDLGRFSTVYISAFAVNLVMLWVMVHVFHWPAFLSQCLITFITTIFSWVGHNRYSFRRPEAEADASSEPGPDAGAAATPAGSTPAGAATPDAAHPLDVNAPAKEK